MDLEIGKEAAGFYIESVLGQGGMGVVYKAQDVALARDVALKVIKPELARDEQFVRRFQTEARVLAKLNSPHIVGVHALQRTESGLFIVMEYVEGGDLSELLTGDPFPVERALEITKQLLRAIERAHEAGVIHRDIKPQNIMVSAAGEVKVTDFGLAKLRQPDMMSTMTQGVVGTLYYMAPEQVRGEEIDTRADLWAVGVVLFEMLVGARPFTAEHEAGVMYSLLSKEIEFPDEILGTLPAGLSDVVARALSKDRDDRFSKASEMMAAIDQVERPERGAIPVLEPVDTDGEKSGGGKWLGLAMGIGATAIVAIAGFLFLPDLLNIGAPGTVPADVDTLLSSGEAHTLELGTAERPSAGQERTAASNTASPQTIIPAGTPGSTNPESAPAEDSTRPAADEPTLASGDDSTPPPAAVTTGTVSLLVDPASGATVSIDGGRTRTPGSVTLPVGSHTVSFRTPNYSEIQETVVVSAGANNAFTCHFEGTVRIPGTNPRAHVLLNGEATGDSTPAELRLGPGDYEVSVRLFGYTVALTQGAGLISIAPSCALPPDRRLVFELTESGP